MNSIARKGHSFAAIVGGERGARRETLPASLRLIRRGFQFIAALSPGLAGRLAATLFMTPQKKKVSSRSAALFQEAERLSIPFGGRGLAAYVWEAEGPTVLLVHGWEANASSMRHFVMPLREQGFRVVAFDAPAHGNSTGKQTHLIELGKALETVIQKLGPVDSIVAHSLGAMVTLLALGRSPSIAVKRFVSIGAPSRANDLIDMWCGVVGLKRKAKAEMRQRVARRLGVPLHILTAEEAVAGLELPGLIIHDLEDERVPFKNSELISDNWTNAQLMSTRGLGHRGALRDARTIGEVVSFLTNPIDI